MMEKGSVNVLPEKTPGKAWESQHQENEQIHPVKLPMLFKHIANGRLDQVSQKPGHQISQSKLKQMSPEWFLSCFEGKDTNKPWR